MGLFSLGLLLGLIACGEQSVSLGERPEQLEVDRADVTQVASAYPLFAELGKDQELNGLFERYMTWAASLGVPDAVLVVKLLNSKDKTIDSLATVFHERVEFKGWLD